MNMLNEGIVQWKIKVCYLHDVLSLYFAQYYIVIYTAKLQKGQKIVFLKG